MPSRSLSVAKAIETELKRWQPFIDESTDLRQVHISVRLRPGSCDTRSVVVGMEHERSTKSKTDDE
jgi:hypothetical protein